MLFWFATPKEDRNLSNRNRNGAPLEWGHDSEATPGVLPYYLEEDAQDKELYTEAFESILS